jgi:hypothetical protein
LAQVALQLYNRATLLDAMTRVVDQGLGICVLSVCLAMLAFESHAAGNDCDRILLDSIKGATGMRHERIQGLATSHELDGIADFVLLNPPDWDKGVRRIILRVDLQPSFHPTCRSGPDLTLEPGMTCAESVPGTVLKLSVTLEPNDAHDLDTRMDALVNYVSKDVLCELDYF